MEKRKSPSQIEIEIRRRVEAKYDERNALFTHLISYVGVNILLWAIWLTSPGFPWPMFVSFFWGIGMAGHLTDYYQKHGGGARKREERIQEEVRRQLERFEDGERLRSVYDEDELEDADVYDLDDVELRHVRLSDDGELEDFERLDRERLREEGRS